jgi:hypothetical protein
MGLGEKLPDPSWLFIYNSSFASANYYNDAVSGVTSAGIIKVNFFIASVHRHVFSKKAL